jgi:hypothetical protein
VIIKCTGINRIQGQIQGGVPGVPAPRQKKRKRKERKRGKGRKTEKEREVERDYL